MEISAELIKQFFNGACTAEEAELVANYFYTNPELLNKYFGKDEDEFAAHYLSKKESELLLRNIKKNASIKVIQLKSIKRIVGVAASVLVFVCFYQLFLSTKKAKNETVAQIKNNIDKPWLFRMNNTSDIISSNLEDGTSMRLQPHSFIKYQSFNGRTKRDVFLNGEVLFKVAKDKTKPFTVYAGNLTTTALGTQFNVKDNQQTTTIQLFEGKVVIKTIVPNVKWKNNVYLMPGQQLIFNKKDFNFIVKAIGDTSNLNNKLTIKKNELKFASTTKMGNWYMFNNQALHNVFEQLEELYNIKIEYKRADISNVYFIGRFEKTDSVAIILNNIALLKKLHIEHKGNTYIISKK